MKTGTLGNLGSRAHFDGQGQSRGILQVVVTTSRYQPTELTSEFRGLGERQDQAAVFGMAVDFLRDMLAAWRPANQDQRNRMAHLLF